MAEALKRQEIIINNSSSTAYKFAILGAAPLLGRDATTKATYEGESFIGACL